MIRVSAAFTLLALLTACGADGAPETPAAKPGVTVTGDARIGMVGHL